VKKKDPEHSPDDAEQSARFVEKAKELGVDESADAFERALGKITPPAKPPTGNDKRPI
jgi:hypothetical protein